MFRNPSVLFNYLLVLSFSVSAQALASTTIETRIHDLITPAQLGEAVQILSTVDGRVYEVDSSHALLAADLLRAQASKSLVTLTLNGAEHIVGVDLVAAPQVASLVETRDPTDALLPVTADEAITTNDSPTIADSHNLGYQATNYSSMSDAQSLFDSLPALRHHSQCFQRAHIWAYQMYSQRSTYSMKVFLFFTRAFIQQHHYKWWFHVAPFVYVQGQEIVLDPEFVNEPREMHHWTDNFMMDQSFVRPALDVSPDCSGVASYSDYEDNQMAQYCYTLKLPMYYYQPQDAEALSKAGTRVETFRGWDVQNSSRARP